MPAFRLVFLVAVVVGVLAAIAASTSNRTVTNGGTTATVVAEPPARVPSRIIPISLPRTTPIEAHVGDTIELKLTLKQGDTVAVDAFGFQEGIASGVPTTIGFVATVAGRYELVARQANKPLATIVVTPPPLLKPTTPESGGTSPTPTAPTPASPTAPAPTSGTAAVPASDARRTAPVSLS